MKILITGGSGFIGKNFVEYFSEKYEVLAPSHKELELLDEKAVEEFLKKNKVDIIIHTAAKGGSRKLPVYADMLKENLKMFFNLANNSKYYKKMIFLGSGAEYDKSKDIKEVKESEFGKSIPKDEYGFYKFICSKYIELSEKIINLRLFGVFGKYEDYDIRFISNIICRILFDLPVEINQNAVFDFVYIKDLCRIIEYFIENNAKERFYNVGGEKHIELTEIVDKIRKISGKNFQIKIKILGMNKEYTCNNSRLLKEIKNFKFTGIDEAINLLYNWYLGNKQNIKMANKKPEVSITIPIYNEENSIEKTVVNLVNEFEKQKINYELVLVNHGSWDNTKKVLEKLAKKNKRLKVNNLEKNLGYGGGIQYGFEHSDGDYIGFTCADEEVSAQDVCKIFLALKNSDYDFSKSRRMKRKDGIIRIITTTVFNSLISLRFGLGLKDVNGYPIFMKKDIFPYVKTKELAYLFNLDLLKNIKNNDYKILEVPIIHRKREIGETFMKPSRILKMAFGFFKYSMKF